MADESANPANAAEANAAQAEPPPGSAPENESESEEAGREKGSISDFVRRAMSAGFEVASRSKEDFVRVATTEVRQWLGRLDLDHELTKALSKMTIEVKAEFRFRPNESGALVPEVVNKETKIDAKIDTRTDTKLKTKP